MALRDWAKVPPRPVRMEDLVTTTKVLHLDRLLSPDSTFFGDLFPHVVRWRGELYLEDGLHRASGRPCTSARSCTPESSTWTQSDSGTNHGIGVGTVASWL
ncbi:hypothetical protein [Saccharopolyspora hattusasensis]|uniref:hypothetical protein n=1 Tax=Saccharopolyspora hattusasensis TaxID=1128679 RepID=UPI003D967582